MTEEPQLEGLGVRLDDLISLVEGIHPAGDELAALNDAVVVSEHLAEISDHLVGHFVEEARRAGASWSLIGAAMGVTKQAVQQRFVPAAWPGPRRQLFRRFTPRARQAIEVARDEARERGQSDVGCAHMLAGLMSERDGLAARAVVAMGASPATVAQQALDLVPAGPGSARESLPFSAACKTALRRAVKAALLRGHNYIGTEHLLLALLEDEENEAARALRAAGIERKKTEAWLDGELARLSAKEQKKRKSS